VIAGGVRGGGGMTRRLPLVASLRAAAAFAPRALARAPGALALFAVVLAAPFYVSGLGGWAGPVFGPVSAVLALLSALIAQGALYRLGVSRDVPAARALGLGPLGLQFGAAEMRLLAASVLAGLFLGLVLLALGVVLVIIGDALQISVNAQELLSAPEGWRLLVMAGFVVLAVWAFLQLAIRLSLYKAATVARRRIVSVSALGLSEHNFWRLLCGLVVSLLPTIAIAAWRGGGGDAGVCTGALLGAVTAFVQTPLSIGFLSEAYRRLEYWREHPAEG
jgi:hypothetical protein